MYLKKIITAYETLLGNQYLTFARLAQFLIAIAIYAGLLLMPLPHQSTVSLLPDYTLHAIGNGLLMLSAWLASGGRHNSFGLLLFVFALSLSSELIQGFTSYRTPDISDVLANFMGATGGFIVCAGLDFVIKYLRQMHMRLDEQ